MVDPTATHGALELAQVREIVESIAEPLDAFGVEEREQEDWEHVAGPHPAFMIGAGVNDRPSIIVC